ncbi:hypothetical protein HHL22_10825 [Hymenobacter sp. RP-2-7]|uniref:STAS/SEC14 domain-containing protein n=1 Tax=Hymenobacter polaris TaxID=2682546 RepID=A0A7Y0FMC1_9BACT|nr:hypothetical protein [Hymenobacter polaris]NML65698.1 hypothetical protein [Hymenobacter polaris]
MPFYNTAELRIQHDEALGLLRAEWMGDRSLARLQPALVTLQQLAEVKKITHVQLELNSLPDLSVFDQIWLATHWMPTVLPLPLQQVVLVLGSARVYNVHAIETLLAALRGLIHFDVQFFAQSEAGLHWLVPDPAALARLLAEWQPAHNLPGAERDSFAEYPPACGPPSPLALPT